MEGTKIREKVLRPNSGLGSGRVRRFVLPDSGVKVTQITTFCPDVIGPGPVHVYLIEDDGLVMLDAGIPTALAIAFFYHWRNQPAPADVASLPADHAEKELLTGMEIAGYSVDDIDLLVISHGHLDHFLLGATLLERKDMRVAAHVLDTPSICNPWGMVSSWMARQDQIAAAGIPGAVKANRRFREAMEGGYGFNGLRFSLKVDSPVFSDGPLRQGGAGPKRVRACHLPGHTPGSLGLMVGAEEEEKILLCGDVLLYPITPHPDDLPSYLHTIETLRGFERVSLTLPAHGKAIRDLRSRAEFLQKHHEKRLKLTYDACSKPQCVWDIASKPGYFNTFVAPDQFNYLAATEALVHMELLAMVHGLRRTGITDRVHYFQNSGEPFKAVYARIAEMVIDGSSKSLMRY
jgi:glyoxylase-like metal-dependent hydrolase (beta-lactamase superfamily II)